MDNGRISGVLFLDLKKALDTINHENLISLEIKIICFKSYIKGRKQVYSVNNKLSNTREINCRIPLGSKLGPLLFLLYINDLTNCLETTNAALFAEDTSISCEGFTHTEIESKLNQDVENIHRWLTGNKLTPNKVKTEFMVFGSRYRLASNANSPKILIDGHDIKQVKLKSDDT